MELVEKKCGLLFFKMQQSKSYQDIQTQFENGVSPHDPSFVVVNFLQDFPYHLDALLQLYHFFLTNHELVKANEIIERSLCVCEYILHPLFSFSQGNCRLDYEIKENRAFYLVLMKRAVLLHKRGCYRTSLELIKLIFSLSPESDPLALLLCIDVYALKAANYSFLLQFANKWKEDKNLFHLPNFAFSVALALFHSSKTNESLSIKADNQVVD
ncbi:hypothetical protein HELRODRAFT_69072 [Helobdella robusta]|uniref:Transcription factor 25 n=1 Tax=Helobdella robusta TaxID=6412 RepID=T1FZP1_HELRO|nr:hypothetical protein HELRODRAFT_69072 [Helobdella robusta]ESN94378.1 hypothetical protein HELRODRAFT_69072 [Helobdella robusta]